jgi:hypothetical protein
MNLKRYDTQTAELIAEWDNGGNRSDFRHCSESLYRTKNGAWFLHGRGGALSKYAEPCEAGRGTQGGCRITPLSEEQAAAWLADNDVDAFERHFAAKAVDA